MQFFLRAALILCGSFLLGSSAQSPGGKISLLQQGRQEDRKRARTQGPNWASTWVDTYTPGSDGSNLKSFWKTLPRVGANGRYYPSTQQVEQQQQQLHLQQQQQQQWYAAAAAATARGTGSLLAARQTRGTVTKPTLYYSTLPDSVRGAVQQRMEWKMNPALFAMQRQQLARPGGFVMPTEAPQEELASASLAAQMDGITDEAMPALAPLPKTQ